MTPEPMPSPQPPAQKGKSSLTVVIIVVIALFGCCVFGVIGAIAVPNFLKFQSRSKMSECRANLKALYVSQASYFSERDDYGDTFKDIGFAPEPHRYTYFMGEEAVLPANRGPSVSEAELSAIAGGKLPGVYGECPGDCEFVAVCAANLDRDPALDVWSVSSKERVAPDGTKIREGEVFHDEDDTR